MMNSIIVSIFLHPKKIKNSYAKIRHFDTRDHKKKQSKSPTSFKLAS